MHLWLVLLKNKGLTHKGFTLIELIIALIIMGVFVAIALPNVVNLQREGEARKAYSQIKGALIQAQTNADRQGQTCTVEFSDNGDNSYLVTGNPNGCVLESFTIDMNIVSVTKSNFSKFPTNISFSIVGKTSNASTLWITRKDFQNNPLETVARCIVVSSTGMIRTGFNDGSKCNNVQNIKYDNSVIVK